MGCLAHIICQNLTYKATIFYIVGYTRAAAIGLTDEELEIFDLLIMGKKLTKAQEQEVLLTSRALFKKLQENRQKILVVDWYKDEQTRAKVKNLIEDTLDAQNPPHLPDCYDNDLFSAKSNLLLNHFIDMAVQGYGWLNWKVS